MIPLPRRRWCGRQCHRHRSRITAMRPPVVNSQNSPYTDFLWSVLARELRRPTQRLGSAWFQIDASRLRQSPIGAQPPRHAAVRRCQIDASQKQVCALMPSHSKRRPPRLGVAPRCRGSVMLGLGGGADGVVTVAVPGSWKRSENGCPVKASGCQARGHGAVSSSR